MQISNSDYITDTVRILREFRVLDIIIPFILIFAVVFAFLQKMSIFGNNSKKTNVVVALAMTLLVVVPHALYGPGGNTPTAGEKPFTTDSLYFQSGPFAGLPDVVQVINRTIPTITAWLIGVMLFMILIGVFGGKASPAQGMMQNIAVFASLGILIFSVLLSFGIIGLGSNTLSETFSNPGLIAIIVFGLVIYYILGDDKPAGENNNGGGMSEFGKAFFGDGKDGKE